MEELVVLVDEQNNEIGTAPKSTVHTKNTPLHRGFSLFLFNSKGELLVTQRAYTKKTFPGIWSNTVCGHPAPGERAVDAIKRRSVQELGITYQALKRIKEIAPYRYQFSDGNGVMENEICPIFIGWTDAEPKPNNDEVENWRWMKWEEFLREIHTHSQRYSPWCAQEAQLLQTSGMLAAYAVGKN